MAHGKTKEMIFHSRAYRWKTQPEWVQKERDRSLRGKDRIRARKAARR
jgi:hypothetical protein